MSNEGSNNGDGENRRKRDEDEEDDTITIAELIAAEESWNDTATAVLGGSDNKNCSYDQGYVKRQALYACLTCNPKNADPHVPAGICLACSLKCHADHELVELYTKRNFRCDCGNKKQPNTPCQLQPIKHDYNTGNNYNHNFQGLYCVCNRPYPDPEEDEDDETDEDEMLQCVVCEDWFHGRHSENDAVDLESELINTSDFICPSCTKKCDFLTHYDKLLLKTGEIEGASTLNSLDANPEGQSSEYKCNGIGDDKTTCDAVVEDGSQDSGISSVKELEHESSETGATDAAGGSCLLTSKYKNSSVLNGGTWWANGWRSQLCKCATCMEKYVQMKVQFLVDPEDPLEVYEEKGRKSDLVDNIGNDMITQAMGRLSHVQQIEVAHRYNEFKDSMIEMFTRVGGSGRAITAADVTAMFEDMRSNKRRRIEDGMPPDSCR